MKSFALIKEIQQNLHDNTDKKTSSNSQNFFKEKILTHGVRIPIVNNISKQFYQSIQQKPKSEIFKLCKLLWKSGYLEESLIACNWSYYIREKYKPSDFIHFEKWINSYVTNWATCDTLCNHSVGTFIEMYPEYISRLKDWSLLDNRWAKRAAAVSLIIPARKGLFLEDILKIGDTLLLDKDDLVQKGYGWMLKAASEKYQDQIFEYVISKKDSMPRTSLRYAIEKMPPELRKEAMKK